MTTCSGLPADQCAEDYLLGALSEAESAAFEDHYFGCAECLDRLESLRAVRDQLRAHPVEIKRAPIPWPYRLGAIAAIAATLIAAVIVYRNYNPVKQPSQASTVSPQGSSNPSQTGAGAKDQPSLIARTAANLADLNLPAYHAFKLRGSAADPAYEKGMKAYGSQGCPEARKYLAQVPSGEFSTPARFYTGVCLMHEGDLDGAVASLQKVADDKASPHREAALYYLAQVALAQARIATGRAKLEETIALRGDFEGRARAELAKLPVDKSNP